MTAKYQQGIPTSLKLGETILLRLQHNGIRHPHKHVFAIMTKNGLIAKDGKYKINQEKILGYYKD